MHGRKQRALLVGVIVAACGAFVGVGAAKAAAQAKPKLRVFFVEPKNGATVSSPVHMKFGSEGIEIGAVPQGEVKTARPGIAHYHVGIEQDCLASGNTIVRGTPSWVHFGNGASEFDSQLTPGTHKLALQLGDDLHNTMPGACEVITVTVK